jgi:kynurenine 3-monooxygenase
MNCGFEDVRVLQSLLASSKPSGDLSSCLETYTQTRHPSVVAICQLALQNYDEMASKVTSPLFLLRKRIDGILARLLPGWWLPLYTMVTFKDDVSYADARSREARQATIVEALGFSAVAVTLAAAAVSVRRMFLR